MMNTAESYVHYLKLCIAEDLLKFSLPEKTSLRSSILTQIDCFPYSAVMTLDPVLDRPVSLEYSMLFFLSWIEVAMRI